LDTETVKVSVPSPSLTVWSLMATVAVSVFWIVEVALAPKLRLPESVLTRLLNAASKSSSASTIASSLIDTGTRTGVVLLAAKLTNWAATSV